MKRVFKYTLPIRDFAILEMPEGAEILHVDFQWPGMTAPNGSVVPPIRLWALVDPDAPLEKRYFRIAGTGHSIEKNDAFKLELKYLGSCCNSALIPLVFHVFEVIK